MKLSNKINKKPYSQNTLMASRFRIGESSESSKLISLPIDKGDCIIEGFKTE